MTHIVFNNVRGFFFALLEPDAYIPKAPRYSVRVSFPKTDEVHLKKVLLAVMKFYNINEADAIGKIKYGSNMSGVKFGKNTVERDSAGSIVKGFDSSNDVILVAKNKSNNSFILDQGCAKSLKEAFPQGGSVTVDAIFIMKETCSEISFKIHSVKYIGPDLSRTVANEEVLEDLSSSVELTSTTPAPNVQAQMPPIIFNMLYSAH